MFPVILLCIEFEIPRAAESPPDHAARFFCPGDPRTEIVLSAPNRNRDLTLNPHPLHARLGVGLD